MLYTNHSFVTQIFEKVYRDLVKKYPTFRERSEIAEVATEIR
jgi:hypothetical protein